ncbi:hypothetical protein HUU51_01630 [Candidatus Gracilibacteria bacterium]|nr:hypothetical protein [Candidatus Gracilibacteria bacterium]
MNKKEFGKLLIVSSIDAYISGFGKIKNKNDELKLSDFIKKVERKYNT